MIYPPLEELLDFALSVGYSVHEFRLGRVQMQEFTEWAERTGYLSSRASTGAGAPYEYNGIPVSEVARDNRRSYVNEHGNEVIHD
jgi:hypothetical protein